ncbi:MAG: hypothetical protein DHS80DRAFT_14855 [Piptocephalis tieghemiana]|nr:MAG: hypothetical protein DHS80DRAFT_14855 [Piptocephalis tieghemiana]
MGPEWGGVGGPGQNVPIGEQLKVAAAIADILNKQDYLILLSKAMVMYGAPIHRLDANLSASASVLNIEASFTSLPGLLIISFGDADTHTSETKILRVPAGYGLARLNTADRLSKAVKNGELDLEEATASLEELVHAKGGYYPRWVDLLSWVVSSFCSTTLAFQGTWVDAGVAAMLGLGVGSMSWLAAKLNAYSDLFEITAAVVVSFIAAAMRHHICYQVVTLSAVVLLLPGLALTTSVMELASRNMVSGAVRMFHAIVMAFILGFGLSLGTTFWRFFDPFDMTELTVGCAPGPSPWYILLNFPFLAWAFVTQLQGSFRQMPVAFAVSALGFACSYFTGRWLDSPTASPTLAAFVIGVAGNLYARFTGELAIVPVLPAILLLVPGSMGVRGTLAFLSKESSQGTAFAGQMVLVALGITVGLFAAALVVIPIGRRRRSAMMAV